MAASTNLSIHVAGPIAPQANIGAANAYVTLGVCQDGADITIQPAVHGIKSDGGGGPNGQPVEYIQLNVIATIRFKLVPFAGAYVDTLRAMAIASASEGTLVTPGTLFGLNGFLPNLYLPSADGDGPWLFYTCRVVKPGDNGVRTTETTPDWEFQATAWFNPSVQNSVNGVKLYQRAAPP